MLHFAESRRRLSANPLGRGVGGHEFRMPDFELLQLAHQLVVLSVRDLRGVEDVVEVVVAVKLLPQLLDAVDDCLVGHGNHLLGNREKERGI